MLKTARLEMKKHAKTACFKQVLYGINALGISWCGENICSKQTVLR